MLLCLSSQVCAAACLLLHLPGALMSCGGKRYGEMGWQGRISSHKGRRRKGVIWFPLINPPTQDLFLTVYVCRLNQNSESLLPNTSKIKGPCLLSASKLCRLQLSVQSAKIASAKGKRNLLSGEHGGLSAGDGSCAGAGEPGYSCGPMLSHTYLYDLKPKRCCFSSLFIQVLLCHSRKEFFPGFAELKSRCASQLSTVLPFM